jgi:hypothetical protein
MHQETTMSRPLHRIAATGLSRATLLAALLLSAACADHPLAPETEDVDAQSAASVANITPQNTVTRSTSCPLIPGRSLSPSCRRALYGY